MSQKNEDSEREDKDRVERIEKKRRDLRDKELLLKAMENVQDALRKEEPKFAIKTFDEIVNEDQKDIVVNLPHLKMTIKLRPLEVDDYDELQKHKTGDRFIDGYRMVYQMWKKKDPTVKWDKVRKLSIFTLNKILNSIPGLEVNIPLSKELVKQLLELRKEE